MTDQTSARRQLYRAHRHPYYVVAPDFRSNSAGIRVMHQLCDALRQSGEDAWIVTGRIHPRLDTPVLTAETRHWHERQGLVPIAIYPEIVGANPLSCRVVTRYILNFPGLLGERPTYSDEDIYFVHAPKLLDTVPNPTGILYLPTVDTSVFNNLDNPQDGSRDLECIYFGRYLEGREAHAELAKRCTVITSTWPATPPEMARLLRRSMFLYCFENTALITEARLCGCAAVMLPSPYFSQEKCFSEDDESQPGIAYTRDEADLARARETVGDFDPLLLQAQETTFWQGLDTLIEVTQKRAAEVAADDSRDAAQSLPSESSWTGSGADAGGDRYQVWRSRRTLQEIDGQILAERMFSKWRFRPRFAIGVQFADGNGDLLANTIDSLARQWYPEWQLVVFAPGVASPPELAGIAQIAWLDDPVPAAGFAALAAARDADFYAILPNGTILEDHALQMIADELNATPQWLAVYSDHDETGSDGGGAQPRFKPDFNPELLYSTDYIGPTAFVCKEALQAFGTSGEVAAASPFGMLLQLFERTGSATIGHVADPLLHLPPFVRDDAGERAAVERHLARRGRPGRVDEGWFEHTRRVRFEPPAGLRISVIVMTHSQTGYLRRCLETLLQNAGMPVAELIVVAHRVEDPDLADFLATAADGALGVSCRVLAEPGGFEPARFRNRAAAEAGGDYLLFVDDDVEFFQPDCLAALAGHARACGLAAVGPRLVSSSDGPPRIVGGAQLLGMFGLAGGPADGQPGLLDTRHDLRLQLDQQVSALPASCLLVERSWFERLGGFDMEAAPRVLHDLDLCIRLNAAGGRSAWLASVDVAHQEGVTVREATHSATDRAEWTIATEREREVLLARHLEALAKDPAYNRHLSLREPFALDIELVADWNPRFHDRPRLLGVPLTTGAGQYRVVAPLKALARAGLAQSTIVHPIRDNTLRAVMPVEIARLAPDTVIVQNCIEDKLIAQLAASARLNSGVRHVGTIDDRLGDLPRGNPLYPTHARQARTQLRKGLAPCSRLIVTTEPLRQYCEDLIGDIRVVPNRLERDAWSNLEVARNSGERPRIGWVGAMQHGGDLKLLEPVVAELADEVDWVFMGMCPEALKPYVREVHEFVSIRDYPAKMASLALDLALAPLEIHPFNECKSNLRLLEYGALGWPVICTDIDPYRTADPPVARLPNVHSAWIDAIRERIHERDSLQREGTLLRKWVYDNFILEDALNDWLAALSGD